MACNLACSYCYNSPFADPLGSVEMISVALLRKLYEGLTVSAAQKLTVIWHGGEPTLAGIDFFASTIRDQDVIRATGRTVHNCIQTNGTRLTDDWCVLFAKNDIRPSLSVDGPTELHDQHRRDRGGHGTHGQVMQAIARLRKHNVDFGLLVVVTRDTLSRVDALFDWIVEHHVSHLDLLPCFESNRDGQPSKRVPTNDELSEFFIRMFDRWWEHDDPTIRIRTFQDILRDELGGTTRVCSWRGNCSWIVSLNESGRVYPCARFHGFNDIALGELGTATLPDILKSPRAIELRQSMARGQEECLDCRWLRVCGGGCPFARYATGGTFSAPYAFCKMRQRLFEHIHLRCEASRDK